MLRCVVLFVAGGLAAAGAAESIPSFSQTLTSEQRERLGLDHLTNTQLAELDAAVRAYTIGETTGVVATAVQPMERSVQGSARQAALPVERKSAERILPAEKNTAKAAVADFQKQPEPVRGARPIAGDKRPVEEDRPERFVARIVGRFHGWSGGTYFPLDNGEVWRQAGTESNERPGVQNAEVELYKSSNGYWRLKYEGAWITVKRLQ